jgi:hypothetical protein
MSDVRKFKFVSPGIFLREIDNSQLPAVAPEVGPVFIGRARKGPANRPYTVQSFSEFVDVFGAPEAGGGGGDYFREGNIAGPTYGGYAAQAYLDAQVGPVTFVRTLGEANPSADTTDSQAVAGWTTKNSFGDQTNNNAVSPSPAGGIGSRYLNGGAYGLFVLPSGSAATGDMGSGSLAAIWYCNSGSAIILSGAARGATYDADPINVSGTCIVLESDSGTTFTAEVVNSTGQRVMKTEFNFNRNSDRYIRKVFNTNPALVNNSDQGYGSPITNASTLSDGEGTYWLGETYESYLFDKLGSTSPGKVYGFIAAVNSGSTALATAGTTGFHDRQQSAINPRTGWFFSQDLTVNGSAGGNPSYDARSMTKLFRFYGRDGGEAIQEQFKISIQDIRAATNNFSSYGSFTVVVRAANDTDAKPVIIERFSECNLDPQSANYIARKIGDRYVEWDYNDSRTREYGEFANRSEIVRVEMNPDLNSAPAELLPFGVFGPPRPPGMTILSGTGDAAQSKNNFMPLLGDAGQTLLLERTFYDTGDAASYSFLEGSGSCAGTYAGQPLLLGATVDATNATAIQTSILGADNGGCKFTGSVFFPATLTRLSASDHGSSDPQSAYWGLQTNYYDNARTSTTFDMGYRDYLRGLPYAEASRFGSLTGPPTNAEYSWIFSLDDLVVPGGKLEECYWMSGSRSGVSRENVVSAGDSVTSASYKAVLDSGLNRFTSPLFGGYDGFNIIEKDPFRDGVLTQTTTQTELNNYAFNTIAKAINTVKDPEFVEMNLLSVPGVVNENLTQKVLNVCEDRGDALGVIDLRGIYLPFTENANDFKTRVTATSLDGVVTALRDRQINSSYGCAYYPWVQIRDTVTGQFLWAPPSVAAIGTMASSERASEVWFAPAGFNRGGLSKNGAAGIPVTAVTEKLTSSDRDKLYEANINPIATFPSEGIVIFGQKTLQVTPSALDRVNVRRLMIFIKKEISRIAAGILFDQNVPATWLRFTGQAEPLLASVKARMGLTEFRVVLDETTTTPDLVDRNILYAKIFLKPARAIEFIAIDFNITRTGAAFTD